MTAIAAIKRPDGIFLMADGAGYGPDGTLLKIAPKVVLMPHVPAALAGRGSSMILSGLLSLQVESILSFDQLIEYMPHGLKVATKMAGPIATLGLGGGRAEVVVCGWSAERERPEIWVIANQPMKTRGADNEIVDTPAYEAIEWQTPYLGQMPSKDLCQEFGFALPVDPTQFEPLVHGVAWFHALRRNTVSAETDVEREYFGATEGLHLVGGFLQIAGIYSNGIDSKIIQRWPDTIGSKIEPK